MTITCQDRERIFLDGSAEEWAALEQHAVMCAPCTEELRAWKQLSAAAAELRDYQEAPALWTLIESSLREQQAAPATHRNLWHSFDFWTRISHGWQMALVGAMVVLLATSGEISVHASQRPKAGCRQQAAEVRRTCRSRADGARLYGRD